MNASLSDPVEPVASTPESSAIRSAARFFQRAWLRVVLISSALLLPCFWHGTIQAGDLASHVYNAWLAQLIERGQAPGLWLASQWNNVLFDLALLHLGNLFGLRAAERIVVCAAVLIFFWGAFALVCAMSNRVVWLVLPCLAMLAYGWTFAQGFFNYYISVGLAFWGLALIRRGRGWERCLSLALVPPIWMAQALGLALLAGAGTYIIATEYLPPRAQVIVPVSAIAVLLAARAYLSSHFHSLFTPDSALEYLIHSNGADQLILYGSRYRLLSQLLLVLIVAAVLADYLSHRKERGAGAAYRVPLQLYGLALLAGFVLPWVIFLPHYGAPLGMLTERLSLVTAVFACCVLGAARSKPWHTAAFTAIALMFFAFLYQDTGKLDRMEKQARAYARTVPRDARVVASIAPFPGSRVLIHHVVDRACIGYCFSFGNYEPSSGAFRVRATSGNPYVTQSWEISEAIRTGAYTVQPQDLPLFQIYQCDAALTALCMRELYLGDRNVSLNTGR